MKPQPKMRHSQVTLLDALDETSPTGVGPMTRAEIEQFLGLDHVSVGRRIRRLRNRGLLRIVRWERTRCAQAPVYGKANGQPDAPPLPNLSKQERNKRYRESHKVERSIKRYGARSTLVGPFAGLLRPAQE